MAYACNPRVGEVETGGSLGLTGQPAQPNLQASDFGERRVSLWPPNTHMYEHIHEHSSLYKVYLALFWVSVSTLQMGGQMQVSLPLQMLSVSKTFHQAEAAAQR